MTCQTAFFVACAAHQGVIDTTHIGMDPRDVPVPHGHLCLTSLPTLPSFQPFITRDVAIIGGGSTGTYAAIKLRDLNYTVAVIEKKGRLGGHTETFTDPSTGTAIDYGVVVLHNLDVVRKYFGRFNVPLKTQKNNLTSPNSQYYDFSTGTRAVVPPDPTEALQAYAAQLRKYPWVDEGFYIPDNISEDLLLPFGEFASKYGLGDVVETLFEYGQGLGDFLNQLTLYVMKLVGLDATKNIQSGFLTTLRGNNSEIYGKAEAELGPSVLLHSTVLGVRRDRLDAHGYLSLLVQTSSCIKLIRAKQLLVTIPPKYSLFSQFNNSHYITTIINNTGLPGVQDGIDYTNAAAHGSTPFDIPKLPAAYGFSPTGVGGLVTVEYGAPAGTPAHLTTDDAVKEHILETLARLRRSAAMNFTTPETQTPEFVVFSNHSPFELTVGAEAIKRGFYRELYALQGYRNTWWTGAAWHTQDSSLLWRFTEGVVESLVTKL
ncbi:hypothetical protein C8Q74DRAFT_1458039 [Fomes fomentarius]|nr:hypothetical protein C8Q74DRAFT_1458039 [Fomes fomentarius]